MEYPCHGEDYKGKVEFEKLSEESKTGMDYLVLSPGVPIDSPLVLELKKETYN